MSQRIVIDNVIHFCESAKGVYVTNKDSGKTEGVIVYVCLCGMDTQYGRFIADDILLPFAICEMCISVGARGRNRIIHNLRDRIVDDICEVAARVEDHKRDLGHNDITLDNTFSDDYKILCNIINYRESVKPVANGNLAERLKYLIKLAGDLPTDILDAIWDLEDELECYCIYIHSISNRHR